MTKLMASRHDTSRHEIYIYLLSPPFNTFLHACIHSHLVLCHTICHNSLAAANFEGAIEHYTKCIDALRDEGKAESPLAMKAYSNRAACYKQISNFDGTIGDCSAVLEIEPDNVKALIRRAQAFEGVERYRFSLEDCKTVLQMPYEKVGKTNWDLCNMMQHRLNRTVAQLKKMDSR